MSLLNFFGVASKLSPDPTSPFWYESTGRKTLAGVSVDEAIAMTYSACWASTRLLAGTGGWLPLNFYRSIGGGGSEIAKEHRVHRLIHYQPNDDMASMAFRCSRINHQVNWGNCYAEIERNGGNEPIALHPIHPSRIPKPNIRRSADGKLYYLVNNNDGTQTPIKQRDMFHVSSIMSDDGIVGRGVVENARLAIGFGIATEQQGASYFGNSARPKIVLEGGKFKEKSDREDFRRQWEEVHGGPGNANKPALMPEGMKLTALDFSAEDSQFLETRQHNIEEIARWYGVPPHMIGHLLRSTFNNIEHLGIEFVQYSLMPWLKLWEQEIWRKLLTPEEQRQGYYAKFVVDALERGDKASRTASSVQEFFNGHLTLNQWAERDDMNPIGPLGDLHFVQSAMVPLEIAALGPQGTSQGNTPGIGIGGTGDDKPADGPSLSVLELTLALQKIYLAVGKVISAEEAREILNRGGAGLSEELPEGLPSIPLPTDGFGRGDESPTESTDEPEEPTEIDEPGELSVKVLPIPDSAAVIAQLQAQHEASQRTIRQLANAMLRDVSSRLLSVEVNAVKRVAEKPTKFVDRLAEFYDKHTATLSRSLVEPLAACLAAAGDAREPATVATAIAASHVAESKKQLDALLDCQPDELSSRVEQCVSRWHEERAGINLSATSGETLER